MASMLPPAMAYEFKLPDLGEGLTEGEIARWLVAEGQEIAEDDPLVEIATDKTTVEIPSPAAGVVSRILVGEGEVVPVGTLLVVIDGAKAVSGTSLVEIAPSAHDLDQEQAGARARPAHVGTRSAGVRATPLVRRVAQELGVDLSAVAGSGPQGRVTEDGVRAAAQPSVPGAQRPEHRVPIRGVKQQMFDHLSRAHAEIAPVTWVEEC